MGTDDPHSPDEIERQIEDDPTLIPRRPSVLLVEPSVLDRAELEALLLDLGPLLAAAMHGDPLISSTEGASYEPHPASVGCDRRYSKLSPFAWLFTDHAGAGRPAGDQQGHHLRARGGTRKKARATPRQTQGSLFGNRG